jgi:hypothetical protein
MSRPPSRLRREQRPTDPPVSAVRAVTDESLVVRNYDATTAELAVEFVDADDEVAFRRTYAVPPGGVVSTPARLSRGVYRVVARPVDDTDASDATACLVGSGPSETAVVETGNGVVSVSEGVV